MNREQISEGLGFGFMHGSSLHALGTAGPQSMDQIVRQLMNTIGRSFIDEPSIVSRSRSRSGAREEPSIVSRSRSRKLSEST